MHEIVAGENAEQPHLGVSHHHPGIFFIASEWKDGPVPVADQL